MNREEKEKVLQSLPQSISPYKLSKLEGKMRDCEVKPQKIYNYIRQGYIKSTKNSLGHYEVSREESRKHLSKYLKDQS